MEIALEFWLVFSPKCVAYNECQIMAKGKTIGFVHGLEHEHGSTNCFHVNRVYHL